MPEFILNVCSMGDPLNPGTWSATPFNICSELAKKGFLGNTYDVAFNDRKFLTFIIKAASAIYYRNSKDISRGTLYKAYRSNKLSSLVEKGSHTLHLGSGATPFTKKPDGHMHYLYTDSTWNLWSSQSTDMDGYTSKLIKDAENLENKSYNQFTHIFTISEYVKSNLVDHYKIDSEKITVVGTGRGVLEPYFGEKDYTNKKILFTAKGRFTDKGGELVLDAFEKARKKDPDLQLTIVGKNDYGSKINMPNVKTLGFIPVHELQDLFNTHSMFIMPALHEPWGLVYIEALACKMPIIGLNKNAFPEISGKGKYGYMLDSTDPNDLSALLIKAASNPQELENKGLDGQKYCLGTFAWDRVVDTILTTIKSHYIT
jgi:glycosyltransferase involved in cell wall biosynthesis